jgi:hypothetical protein
LFERGDAAELHDAAAVDLVDRDLKGAVLAPVTPT